jgi:DNA-binding NarL/FixJ family response regulator
MRKLRILLAEDHATVRDGLKMIVDAQPDMMVVAEAADGRAALSRASEVTPDVVVLDVSMPRLNGLKAAALLREQCPRSKVLALTRHSEAGYLKEVLRAGASGYVLKQSSSSTLLSAIRAVAAGGTYLDPAIAARVVSSYGISRHVPSSTDEPIGLTGRENEVVRLVASGYTNKDIAARLSVSVKTVETHKANAMQKLGLRSRIELVRFARLQGWLDEEI